MGAHLLGGAELLLAHRDRIRSQARASANTGLQDCAGGRGAGRTAYSELPGAKLEPDPAEAVSGVHCRRVWHSELRAGRAPC